MDPFLSGVLRSPRQQFVLRSLEDGVIVASHVETAFDSASRRRGLLGRTDVSGSVALIIAPCPAIHTFFMRVAIDVVFVTRLGRILKTYSALPAWRIGFSPRAFAAIELPQGTVARAGLRRDRHMVLTAL